MVLTSSSVSRLYSNPGVGTVANPRLFSGCIGEVVENMELVKAIEARGSASGTPKGKVTIANSGVV
jgi:hypothetical protein